MPDDSTSPEGDSWILFVGDVFGRPGRQALERGIARLSLDRRISAIVINGENLAGGKGLNLKTSDECFRMGVTAITTGNHLFDQKNAVPLIETDPRVLRPANYSSECPGRGAAIFTLPDSRTLGVINLIGRVFMAPSDCPFHTVDRVLKEWDLSGTRPDFIAVDFHGEATGEKRAMGFHLDGRVDVVYGTHTHVQTNDLERLPKGTLFLTDVGLTGPRWSIIGVSPEGALQKYRTHVPAPFEVGTGELLFCGLLVELCPGENGKPSRGKAVLVREGDQPDEN